MTIDHFTMSPDFRGADYFAGALDSYRFWMRCIKFAEVDTTPADIIRWAAYADESINEMIAFASVGE